MSILKIIDLILSDLFIFYLFQATLLGIFLVGIWNDHKPRNLKMIVMRPADSRADFTKSLYLFVTIVLITVFLITDVYNNFGIILFFVDLSILTYMFLFNRWWTNRIKGIIGFYNNYWESQNDNE